jgi:hypothetical protein
METKTASIRIEGLYHRTACLMAKITRLSSFEIRLRLCKALIVFNLFVIKNIRAE